MLKFYISLLVLGGLISGMPQEAIAGHEIIGAPKCKTCHKAKTGDQWKIWTESAHAGAFATLASDEAGKIAADQGLGDPQQEAACLKCHATRASLGADVAVSEKAKYADSEGVGCESCHGPGSDYKPKKIMTDPEASRAAGLVMNNTEEACTNCHNEESPTFKGFDFEERWAEIAHPVPGAEETRSESPTANLDLPGEIIFESSVGKVIFPHKVHVDELDVTCAECHHQIHAKVLDTPHPDYMASSWSNCQTCHNTDAQSMNKYYECSHCHLSDLENIANETLSAKVVTHKSCWNCHETGTGVKASQGCTDCHLKEQN